MYVANLSRKLILPSRRIMYAFTFLFAGLGCSDDAFKGDPVPVLTFQSPDLLMCHLDDVCYNPVSTSIREGIPLPDGTMILHSGSVYLSSSDPSVADVNSNGLLTTKKAGECIITATQQPARGYNARAKKSFRLVVLPAQGPQPELRWSIDHGNDYYVGKGDTLVNPLVTNIPSGGEIYYFSTDTTIAKVDGNGRVIAREVGTITLFGTQAGKEGVNRNHTISYRLHVDPRPIITFEHGNAYTCQFNNGIPCGNPWTSTIPAGGGFYVSIQYPIATISHQGIINPSKAGVARVTVTQLASPGVNTEAFAYFDLTILPPVLTMTFEQGDHYVCSTVNGNCKNAVKEVMSEYLPYLSYSSSNEQVCVVDNNGVIDAQQVGTVTVTAHLAAIENIYQESFASYTMRIIDYPIPVVGWPGCGGRCTTYCSVGSTCTVQARTSIPQGGPFVYSIVDTDIATIDPATGIVTPKKNGITLIYASQEELPGVNGPATTEQRFLIVE